MNELIPCECNEPLTKLGSCPTIPERLSIRKNQLEKELALVNEAIDAMTKYPEVAQLLSLINQAIRY